MFPQDIVFESQEAFKQPYIHLNLSDKSKHFESFTEIGEVKEEKRNIQADISLEILD